MHEGSSDTWLFDWDSVLMQSMYPSTLIVDIQTEGNHLRVATSERFEGLAQALREQTNVSDLFKLAGSDDFKLDAQKLTPPEIKELRSLYHTLQTQLDGKVKLEMFDGQVLLITDIQWWHSDDWDNDGVTIRFHPERDAEKTYKSLTSSARIVGFCGKLRDVPSEQDPVRVVVNLQPVRDKERAAQGQKQWDIRQLPMPRKHTNTDG